VQDGWNVLRIENNPLLSHVPQTLPLDVLDWREWIDCFPRPDIILASPPCLEFSNAYNAPKPRALRDGRHFSADMRVLEACKSIIEYTQPTWWIIENVAGANKDFSQHLGMNPTQTILPFLLWGKFPYLPLKMFDDHTKKGSISGSHPLSANLRALIPFELSFSLLQTWKEQRSLLEWA